MSIRLSNYGRHYLRKYRWHLQHMRRGHLSLKPVVLHLDRRFVVVGKSLPTTASLCYERLMRLEARCYNQGRS